VTDEQSLHLRDLGAYLEGQVDLCERWREREVELGDTECIGRASRRLQEYHNWLNALEAAVKELTVHG
jgi:hypothetical protein